MAPPEVKARVQTENPRVVLPPFSPEDPELWFVRVEQIFQYSGIIEDVAKYQATLFALDARVCREIRDLVINIPEDDKYETIKDALIKRLSASVEQKTRELLGRLELGDNKPSQLVRQLKELAGSGVPDSLIRSIWVSRLPTDLQVALASKKDDDLDSQAEFADIVYEVLSNKPRVSEVNIGPEGMLESLNRRIASLEISLQRNRSRTENRSRARSRSRNFRRDRTRTPGRSTCWYHQRYGSRAHRCVKPCSFKSENSQGQD